MSIRRKPYRRRLYRTLWIQTAFCFFAVNAAFSQESPHALSVSVRRAYVASARLFYQPESINPDLELSGLTGYGLHVQVPVPGADLSVLLSADFLSSTVEKSRVLLLEGFARRYTVREGIFFVPIELSMLAYIPLGLDPFRVTMSGGVGTYLAKHLLTVDGVDAEAALSNSAFGIHIDLGFEYRVWQQFSARAEVRFRDPEINVESHFAERFDPAPFKSRVSANGMALSLGVVVNLSN